MKLLLSLLLVASMMAQDAPKPEPKAPTQIELDAANATIAKLQAYIVQLQQWQTKETPALQGALTSCIGQPPQPPQEMKK